MKFEYKLKYDFVNEKLSFQITKMEESLRNKGDIKTFIIDGSEWHIKSIAYPDIYTNSTHNIYLPGTSRCDDNSIVEHTCNAENALTVAKVLEAFQKWVEEEYEEPKVEMTIAEIEKKLGIKNLKIVKE